MSKRKNIVTSRCKKCEYHGYVLFHELCCDYILKTGHLRGCPAGSKCTKFIKEFTNNA